MPSKIFDQKEIWRFGNQDAYEIEIGLSSPESVVKRCSPVLITNIYRNFRFGNKESYYISLAAPRCNHEQCLFDSIAACHISPFAVQFSQVLYISCSNGFEDVKVVSLVVTFGWLDKEILKIFERMKIGLNFSVPHQRDQHTRRVEGLKLLFVLGSQCFHTHTWLDYLLHRDDSWHRR